MPDHWWHQLKHQALPFTRILRRYIRTVPATTPLRSVLNCAVLRGWYPVITWIVGIHFSSLFVFLLRAWGPPETPLGFESAGLPSLQLSFSLCPLYK